MTMGSSGHSSQENTSASISESGESSRVVFPAPLEDERAMQQQRLHNQIEQLLRSLNDTNHEGAMHQEEPPQPTEDEEPEETIHVYFVRECDDPQDQVIETTLAKSQHPSSLCTAAILFFYLCLPLSSILFQLSLAFSPPIATVTVIPNTQTVTLTGTLLLGRLVHPITLSHSQTTPTT